MMSQSPMNARHERKIVVVDDERIIAEDLCFMLEDLGYRVVGIAGDAARAFELSKENRPDLVCMDIVMQGQSDGIDAAIRIRDELDIPSLFMSAYSDETVLDRAMQAAPLGYLIKPYDTALLRCTLEVAFSKLDADRKLADLVRAQASGGETMHCLVASRIVELTMAVKSGEEPGTRAVALLESVADLTGVPVAFYACSDSGNLVPQWSSDQQSEKWQTVAGERGISDDFEEILKEQAFLDGSATVQPSSSGLGGCFLVAAPGAGLSSDLEKTLSDLAALLESTFPCFSSQALEEEVSGLSA